MPENVAVFEVACPAEVVYDYVTDPGRFALWQDDVVAVEVGHPHPAPVARGSPRRGASDRPTASWSRR
ncbi:hypothetical protein [Catellatospora sichuanensis]|uniref:hypothetical protein n=1 Tax=Catellatospora sichuanensis TaxID=1969805 RepID=UPI001182AD2C|nr:hypothetical protein [Catellatospora sichuanensis]